MQDLKNRYKKFAIDAGRLIQMLPKNTVNTAYSNQLIRASSSPGTNYRAACRGKSAADFINKLKIVEEELDREIAFKTFRDFRAKNIQHFNYLFIVARNFPYHLTPRAEARGYHIVAPTELLFSKNWMNQHTF